MKSEMPRGKKVGLSALLGCALGCAILLTGCTVTETTSPEKADEIGKQLTYFKDSHGLCYASVTFATYGFNRGISLTNVPCERVGL